MCNKNSNSPPDLLPTKEKQGKLKSKSKSRSKTKQSSISISRCQSRKIKTRKKKQKFVSLVEIGTEKLEFSAEEAGQQHRQLDLFPLHPEKLVEEETERENENQYDNVSLLFDGADNENAATLNGLLDAEAATTTTTSGEVEESMTFGYSESGTHGDLVRTAMKAKERDASEERWVCYSEVVETKEESVMELEEESICGGGGGDEEEEEEEGHRGWCSGGGGGGKLLALKLDYQEIMEAWSDKGPLYVKGEGPQTVPNLHDGDQIIGSGMWSVPELMVSGNNEDSLMKNEDWRRGHRLASVLRYKEKRQNRLFAKRIRYEVRKLNAEKRPRMKGRFVKRD